MKWLKRIVAAIISIVLLLGLLMVLFNEQKPEGEEGRKAEAMADKMLEAINYQAWSETGAIEWDFGGRHQHIWDKNRHFVQVTWQGNVVQIDINKRVGIVRESENGMTNAEKSKLCRKAWSYWANDSFWLNPVAKVRDDGTSRSLVNYEGEEALMITYDRGGVTPGDSYLWFLQEDGLPYKWKMWVSIIPIGGVSTTWDDWIELATAAKVATNHRNLLTLKLSNIRAAKNLEQLIDDDIFEEFIEQNNDIVEF